MPLAAKEASALNLFSGANPAETMAGPLVAAMMLPATLMMTSWMAFLGASFGAARVVAGSSRDEEPTDAAPVVAVVPPAPSAPRLVVSNPATAERAPAQKAVEAKAAPRPQVEAKPKAEAKPKIEAKPKAEAKPKLEAKLKVEAKAKPKAAPKAQAAPEPAVKAAKPVPAKPSGAPPKPSKPGGTPPKPKSAAAPEAAKAAPLKIETKATSKGISLPKVSMQDKPGEPDKS
jgi:hypothetical protein